MAEVQVQGQEQEQTFTQADVDRIVGQRLARERAGMPSAEELAAYRSWKADEDKRKSVDVDALKAERDTAKNDLAAVRAELEGLKNEKLLRDKGVPEDEIDFYAYKIGKTVEDGKTFKDAAEKYLKENPVARVRVATSAALGGEKKKQDANAIMNDILRGKR